MISRGRCRIEQLNQMCVALITFHVCNFDGASDHAYHRLLLHLRPNYIHSASNDIHTDGPRAIARARG